MIIKLDPQKEELLKKLLGVNNLKLTVEKVIDDWANSQIDLKYYNQLKTKKSIEQMTTDLVE